MMGQEALPESLFKSIQIVMKHAKKGRALGGLRDYVRHNLLSPTDKTIYAQLLALLRDIFFVYGLISLN